MSRLSEPIRASIRLFSFYLGNGTLDHDVLDGIDYRPNLIEVGSELESVFAIFTNNLEVDDATGQVLNEHYATRRAAQWIRAYCDPAYTVDPAFEDWETELHV
jgi:hypothetical protein